MRTLRLCLSLSAVLLAGCASETNLPYHLHSKPENIEWTQDSLDVYPNDVRQDPEKYDRTRVAWVGIVKSSDADEFGDGLVKIHTVFEHHYFDWEQDTVDGKLRYEVSPRGEGMFETDMVVRKISSEANATKAAAYAGPGKMVIIYGMPMGVDDQGVVKLKYRYAEVFDKKNFSTRTFDYGRFGEPVTYLK